MLMRILIAAAALVASLAPAAAAEPCAAGLSQNNPAFGSPRPCGPAKSVKPTAATADKPNKAATPTKVTTEDGKTLYRYGDTTIAVSGSVTGQITFGKTGR